MMDFMTKFSGLQYLVVDFCAGKIAAARHVCICMSIVDLLDAKRMKAVSKKYY